MSFDPQLFDPHLFGSASFSGEGCLFDPNIFDSAVFDTCEEVAQGEPLGGGTSKKRKKLKTKKPRYWSSFEPLEQEIITAVATQQVAEPLQEQARVEQLAVSFKARNLAIKAEHVKALDAERSRLVAQEVSRYLSQLQALEDDALISALAEAL